MFDIRGKYFMVQTTKQLESTQYLKNRIGAMYQYLLDRQDIETADKVLQLGRKYSAGEFAIAMCGHFSAGKSTLINKLLGENILPSSPIPTSANLVRVKSGEEYAKVYFKNEKPRLYLAPYDFKLVKSFCKDGDQIQEIEISHAGSKLPVNTMILDTPGIDSADDAHRIATESAIHLADIVLYVMDYNHVQSELNFLFTKELTAAGKELYLVINQVDKHREEELSFNTFQKSVVDSFASWGVKPSRIFYTSLKKEEHPLNQFKELQRFIGERLATKDSYLPHSVLQSLKKLAYDHVEFMKAKDTDETRESQQILEELTTIERDKVMENKTTISIQINELQTRLAETEKDFDEEIEKILKNAYLMPFQTRALAEAYLKSCQPEFKVGMLFSKGKTMTEKNARLDRFYAELSELVKSQLEWHLRDFLIRSMKGNEVTDSQILAKTQAFYVEFTKEVLQSAVKPGARISGEYVLNYTEDVVNEIKKLAKRKVNELKIELLATVHEKYDIKNAKLEAESVRLAKYVSAIKHIDKREKKKRIRIDEIESILFEDTNILDSVINFEPEEEAIEIIHGIDSYKDDQEVNPVLREPSQTVMINEDEEIGNQRLVKTIERLYTSSHLVKDLPGFQKIADDLIEKADRLKNRGFTVALFGAFSAGKSSFANALLGQGVLPVSPNPTTAAINKIKPVSDQNPHGKVLVKLKEAEMLLNDVNRSLHIFESEADNFEKALEKIENVLLEGPSDEVVERTHYAFLTAFRNGFSKVEGMLGGLIETDLTEFQDYVANEEKSCFVETIELYFDCELTRKGITLVDTPGADSINARHTGVAFDYIKNSDAILFVTYYNHAFSRADREFLIQLGRVKDSFSLDKMFFIINAIDLAESEEEKATVTDYVEEQLIKYGIRQPHLFSVSSLKALEEKQQDIKGMSQLPAFEKSFYHFISNDLMGITMASGEQEIIRVNEMIKRLILTSEEGEEKKEEKRAQIENEKALIRKLLQRDSGELLSSRMNQESEELVYYIKQRVFFRFGDFFKEAFNPAIIKEDGRNLKKAILLALDDLLESLGFDFAQEMRATTVRLERFASKILTELQLGLSKEIGQINSDLSFSAFEWANKEGIDFQSAFVNLERNLFDKALSYFKNPRSFFEKNEKKFMSEELLKVLQTPADLYLESEKVRLNAFYSQILKIASEELIDQIIDQTDDYYQSLLATLDGDFPIEILKGIGQKLDVNL
jgi:small GTP-binding protein